LGGGKSKVQIRKAKRERHPLREYRGAKKRGKKNRSRNSRAVKKGILILVLAGGENEARKIERVGESALKGEKD